MRGVAVAGILAAALIAAPGASAGVATYNSTAPIHVGDDNAPNGDISPITVPPGRTRVQSVEVVNLRIDWGTSAQELSPRIVGTDGTEMTLFDEGCAGFEPQDAWSFSDAAAQLTPNDKFDPKCDLPGGTFRPVDPLSVFAGKAASGVWKLRAIDSGVQFTNQGDIDSWALRITHVPPVLNASPPKSADLDGKLKVLATADADGTVTAGAAKVDLKAGQQVAVPFKVSKKLRKRIEDRGKSQVKVKVAFTDVTGGTANAVVPVKVKS